MNVHNDAGCVRDGSILEYCRLKEVTIQAWSPFLYGFFEGVFIGSEKFPELNKMLDELAEKYHVTNSAIAIAWILRHPAGIQAIVGSTKKQRIAEICKASEIKLTRVVRTLYGSREKIAVEDMKKYRTYIRICSVLLFCVLI